MDFTTFTSCETKFPTRPGTVYVGRYSTSRDTLVEKTSIVASAAPGTATSFRNTVRRVFSRHTVQNMPLRPNSKHHRFRRWLNSKRNMSISTWGDESMHSEDPKFFQDVGPEKIGHSRGGNSNDNLQEAQSMNTLSIEEHESSLAPSLSGVVQKPTLKSHKLDCLRRFRSKLHKTHQTCRTPTLTDRYLGSEENIERCLRDMDSMPFDLTDSSATCVAIAPDVCKDKNPCYTMCDDIIVPDVALSVAMHNRFWKECTCHCYGAEWSYANDCPCHVPQPPISFLSTSFISSAPTMPPQQLRFYPDNGMLHV